jgi:dual oxidase maturation factor 1
MSSQLYRYHGLNARYPPVESAVTVDTTLVSIGAAAAFLAFCWVLCFPTYKSKLHTAAVHFGYIYALYVFTAILLGQWGYSWDQANITTRTQLKLLGSHYVVADIGLYIGLRGINITVLGIPEFQNGERINYNEEFYWTWQQLRGGYGIQSARINREFEDSQTQGRPQPVLWIAEYFTLDGEYIRWGRYYRWAGFYTHIFLWTAIPCWFLSLMLFPIVTKPAALLACSSGWFQIMACILWATLSRRPQPNLFIPFEDGLLRPAYGWCFYLVLLTGISVLMFGSLFWILATFFNFDERFRFRATNLVDNIIIAQPLKSANLNRPSYEDKQSLLPHKGSEASTADKQSISQRSEANSTAGGVELANVDRSSK